MRWAAQQILAEMQEGYLSKVQEIVFQILDQTTLNKTVRNTILKKVLGSSAASSFSAWLNVIKLGGWFTNQLVDVGGMVKKEACVEGYYCLAHSYKNRLEAAKEAFKQDPTEKNAWNFYYNYNILYQLRIHGEEAYLSMSKVGGLVGKLLDLGYKEKEQLVNETIKTLKEKCEFTFDAAAIIPQSCQFASKSVVSCPVDVEVIAPDGTVIATLPDGEECDFTNDYGRFTVIYGYYSEDYNKIICLNDDLKYTLRAKGNDSGLVNVKMVNVNSGDNVYTINNVPVKAEDIIAVTTDAEEENKIYTKYEAGSISKTFIINCSTPVLTTVSNVNGGVKFTWQKVAGAEKYRVFRKTYNASTKKWSSWEKVTDTTAVSYTDKTVKSGTKYCYTSRCITSDGKIYTSDYDTDGKSMISNVTKYKPTGNVTLYAIWEDKAQPTWTRLAGNGRYDTMSEIVKTGFTKTGGAVVVATGAGFKDALAAAGLAGLYDAPVILTDGKSLSSQVQQLMKRLKPSKVYIAGGEAAVNKNVFNSIKTLTGVEPKRCFGQNSAGTSAALATAGSGWSDTAIIATNKTFKDALSAAPVSYSLHMPILLADNGKRLNADVLNALRKCGIKKVIIVGGKLAVTENVEKQLNKNSIPAKNISRITGNTAVDTSAGIAEYGLSHGMTIDGMGIATSQNYPDSLAGAALCGYNNSVLLLADDKAMQNTSFPKKYKADFANGYIFGGTLAVSDKVVKALQEAVK